MIFYKGNRLTGKQHLTPQQIVSDYYNSGRDQLGGDFRTNMLHHMMTYGSHDTISEFDWMTIEDARIDYLNEKLNTYHFVSKGSKWWRANTFAEALRQSGATKLDDITVTCITTKLPIEQCIIQNKKVCFISPELAKEMEAKRTPRSPHKNTVKSREQLMKEIQEMHEMLNQN